MSAPLDFLLAMITGSSNENHVLLEKLWPSIVVKLIKVIQHHFVRIDTEYILFYSSLITVYGLLNELHEIHLSIV